MPAKEGQALAPPGLPIDQLRSLSRPTAATHVSMATVEETASKDGKHCSGLVRGPALIEGKRLETRGQK